jgi:hypothetical protein
VVKWKRVLAVASVLVGLMSTWLVMPAQGTTATAADVSVPTVITVRSLDQWPADGTQEPPAVPYAKLEIVELGKIFDADANGEVVVSIVPGWYTLKATVPGSPYTSTEKRELWDARFSIFVDSTADVNIDYSVEDPGDPTWALSDQPSGATVQRIPIEPTIPTSVTIYSTQFRKPMLFSTERYVKKAVAGEVTRGFYSLLNSTQELEMYKALAITSRSHLDYFMTATEKCSRLGLTYKIDDTANCQKIDYNYEGGGVIETAVNNTSHQIMIYINNYQAGEFEYVAAQFFASDNGTTISSQQKYNAPHPYLQAETDPYDEEISRWVCANKSGSGLACPSPRIGGYHGPGVGLSHDGAAGYAYHNSTALDILRAFYRGVSVYTATAR